MRHQEKIKLYPRYSTLVGVQRSTVLRVGSPSIKGTRVRLLAVQAAFLSERKKPLYAVPMYTYTEECGSNKVLRITVLQGESLDD
jgi:hypothetical protein